MTTAIENLRNRLSGQFPDIQQVDETVVRFLRKQNDRPYAVCYVDVSENIPSTAEDLEGYQNRIVGKHYFEGQKSLQWSNYLYFIVEPSWIQLQSTRDTKILIERDRKFARKFVITLPELEQALDPLKIHSGKDEVDTGILSKWIGILAQANLDIPVLNDESMPKRLDLIEASYGLKAAPAPKAKSVRDSKPQPFLDSLKLASFRDCPLQREFKFGRVNLFCGPNGAGKTSLLESIELIYCGRTKRDPKSNEQYSIHVGYSDGKDETVMDGRPLPSFRDRNLQWYGQSEVRTNLLYESFSRFNFLNTDAAVGLAESKLDIEEDLTKLLVGPEASKAWREIERTKDGLATRIKELDSVYNRVKLELAEAERQLETKPGETIESNSIFQELRGSIQSLNWSLPNGEPEEQTASLVKSMSGLESLLNQLVAIDWAGSPVTEARIKTFVESSEEFCDLAGSLSKQLQAEESEQRNISSDIALKAKRLEIARQLQRYVEIGFSDKISEVGSAQASIDADNSLLSGLEEQALSKLKAEPSEETVSSLIGKTKAAQEAASTKLEIAQVKLDDFAKLRDRSTQLAQELRNTAEQLLSESTEKDTCPLCHTELGVGELAKRIQSGLNRETEEQAKLLFDSVNDCKAALQLADENQEVAKWAMEYCDRSNLTSTTRITTLIDDIASSKGRLANSKSTVSRLSGELKELEQQGFTNAAFASLQSQIESLMPDGESPPEIFTSMLCDEWEKERKTVDEKLVEARAKARSTSDAIEKACSKQGIGAESIESHVAVLRERVATATALIEKLESHRALVAWTSDTSFGELLVSVTSTRKIAADFQATLSKEKSIASEVKAASKRKVEIEKQLAGLAPRLERLREAQDVLQKILSQHSLSSAVDDSLKKNREAIEFIFGRIHAPAEFSGLGDDLKTLVRKNGDVPLLLFRYFSRKTCSSKTRLQ